MAKNVNYNLQKQVINSTELTPTEKLVALMLIWHRNKHTGKCNPSAKTIARESGLGIATVKRAFSSLQAKGFCTHRRTQSSNEWFLNGLGITVIPPEYHHDTLETKDGKPVLGGNPHEYRNPSPMRDHVRTLEQAKLAGVLN